MALAVRWLFRALLWQEPVLARQARVQRRARALRRGPLEQLLERSRVQRRDWEAHRVSWLPEAWGGRASFPVAVAAGADR